MDTLTQSPESAALEAVLSTLNAEQRAAVTHEGPAQLVVAGAGTGKTATLAHRVAWLIARGVAPERILLLTFTRRASAEMIRRAESLLGAGQQGAPRVWGGTFHSVAVRLLRIHARDAGIDPGFTILDRADSEDLIHLCRTRLELGTGAARFPQKSTCADIYSRCVNANAPLDDVLNDYYPWCKPARAPLAQLFEAYTDEKQRQHVLDYDDLLLFWRAVLADPVAGARVRDRFDHVIVDEYQDTNAVQADIVSLMRPDGDGVMCVGDDAQAIYGFRSGTVRNMLDFGERFEGAAIYTLTRNYRSTAPILSATNAIIEHSDERYDKTLWTDRTGGGRPVLVTCQDEAEQTAWLADRILEHREQGTLLKEQSVLFRAQHHSLALEMELSRRNIPYRKYGGLRFIEMAHVKDLVAFLRLAENPLDGVAALRVLGLVPGIGPRTASQLAERLSSSGGDFESWVGAQVPHHAADVWPQFVGLMRSICAISGDVPAQITAIRAVYVPLLERRYDHSPARLADLEQIEAIASGCSERSELLASLALDPPAYTSDVAGPPLLDEDWLVLSTIHSAKGLEFDVVYVIHAADGNIPSDMATGSHEQVEEERRLFYVACSRARNHLYVSHPLRYYVAGKPMADTHGYSQRTRFITESVLPCFVEERAFPTSEPAEDAPTGPAADVRVRNEVRGLWR